MSPQKASSLEAKHYILAALAVTLIAAAVVTVVFVVLSPARITFSVAAARLQRSAGDAVPPQIFLTIAAHNPSRRAAVRYRSMYVDVSNNTGPTWTNWLRADVKTAMPLDQPARNETRITATVSMVGGPWAEYFTGGNDTSMHGFRVMVTTVARFRVGASSSRLYDIKVSCVPIDFFADRSTAANCTAA